MKSWSLAALGGVGLIALAGHAAAAAFANGSFESPGGDNIRTQIGGAFSIPGWTYTPGPGSYEIYESSNQDGLVAADGSHYISFGHNGTSGGSISQVFDTTPGQTYTVTYSVAEQQGQDPTQDLQAIIENAGNIITQDNTSLPDTFSPGRSISFTALGGSATLIFLDATPAGGGGSSNLALDAVAVNGSFGGGGGGGGVPEPAAWAAMLLGLGAVGAAMRRRRTAGIFG